MSTQTAKRRKHAPAPAGNGATLTSVDPFDRSKQEGIRILKRELEMALNRNDIDTAKYALDAIEEALRPLPDGPIDEPLFPLKRPKSRKTVKR